MIDYDKFQKSLKHLEEQYKNYLTLDEKDYLSEIDKEGIAESVIQRFETCYDTLWRVLKRYLNEELGVPEVLNSPKPIFRIAAENKLFNTDEAQWIKYADARIATSHDYSGEKAENALELMNSFIEDAIDLFITMTNGTWE
jgi:nucleotidyltransferase substrate binding protein (TIGR01987 family)